LEGKEGKELGLLFKIPSDASIKINSVSLFKKYLRENFESDEEYEEFEICYRPGDIIEAKTIIEDFYYKPNIESNQGARSVSELTFIDGRGFNPSYYDDYSKISSIEISKSNRFNIL
jgi:hypothetical protein